MTDTGTVSAADLASLQAQLANTTTNIAALQTLNEAQSQNMDDFFLCTMGALVFLMASAGFACLGAGSARSINVTSLFMHNIMNLMVAVAAYWIIGFCFAFGPVGNTIFGWGWITSGNMSDDFASLWFFQFTLAAMSASIMAGAIAERMRLTAYIIFTFIYCAFTYPWATHWTRRGGWLMTGDGYVGYEDFAGSGPVHIVGGGAALIGAIILGPRTGRFTRINGVEQPNPFGGHSTPLVALGGLILFFGFLGFNGGSQLHISQPGDGPIVAVAFMNTCLAGAFGLLVATLLKKLETGKWSLLTSFNGGLAGMVSICAGADLSYQWGAACTGAIAGAIFYITSKVVARFHIDDPVDAIAVQFACGIWSVIAQPIFKRNGILTTWTRIAFQGLAWNLLGIAALCAWTFLITAIVFLALRLLGLLRVKSVLEQGEHSPLHEQPSPMEFNPHLTENGGTGKFNDNDTRNLHGDPAMLTDSLNLRNARHSRPPPTANGQTNEPVSVPAPPPNHAENTPRMQDDRYNM